MKTVLCYGDSLTWGVDAENRTRHAYEDRWPSVLQKALGHGVRVIAEGLNGRTAVYDDYTSDSDRNGARILPTILQTHCPLDLVIILLGTNDMKPVFANNAMIVSRGIQRLVNIIRTQSWPFDIDADRRTSGALRNRRSGSGSNVRRPGGRIEKTRIHLCRSRG